MKLTRFATVFAVSAAAYAIGGTKLLSYASLAIILLKDGQPTTVYSAFLRLPALAKYDQHSECAVGQGKGKCAPYYADPNENDANLEAFHSLPTSEKRSVRIWYDIDVGGEFRIKLNKACKTMLNKACDVGSGPLNLKQFKAALGAGLRSIQDEALTRAELRNLFDAYDTDGTGKLTIEDLMLPTNELINNDHENAILRREYVKGIEFVIEQAISSMDPKNLGMTFRQFELYWFNVDETQAEESATSVQSS